eukprot:gene21053-55235_t
MRASVAAAAAAAVAAVTAVALSAAAARGGVGEEWEFLDDDPDCPPPPTVRVGGGGWVAVVAGAVAAFAGLAAVVDDALCARAGIPDNVAGATLMAAGASSPELFAALVSLFVFNHLVICACSALCARGGELRLDARILARDCTAYALALLLLLYAVSEVRDERAHHCKAWIHIYWHQALCLVAGYVCYATFCAAHRHLLCAAPTRGLSGWTATHGGDDDDGDAECEVRGEDTVSLWLLKKSRWYTGLRVSARAWQRRWCSVDDVGFVSRRARAGPERAAATRFRQPRARVYNLPSASRIEVVDPSRLVFEIESPTLVEGSRVVQFRALSRAELRRVVVALSLRRARYAALSPRRREEAARRSGGRQCGAPAARAVHAVLLPLK